MPGPAPKDQSVRARRNKTATRATLAVHSKPAPALPDRSWHEMTIQWWADVWASPMSPQWDDSDVHNVYLLAMIYDDIWSAETPRDRKDAAAEYRQQRKDLGLTPYDRRRLEWTIEQADEAAARGNRRRQAGQPSAGAAPKSTAGKRDPRAVFSVVS